MSETKQHSCKVPKLYKVASKVLELVVEKGASLKELVFASGSGEKKRLRHPNTKALYALVVATIQNGTVVDKLIRESQILVKEPKLDPWLARILMVELLWGKKKLPISDAKPIATVLEYHSSFLGVLREDMKSGIHENKPRQHKAASKPRYIRVNTLLMSVGDAVTAIRNEGWKRATYPANDYDAFRQKLSSLAEDEFIQDFHIKELFAFPPRTEFYQHDLYRNGSIALQDKATCLAPFVLNPEPGSAVLDMCAAPGMKTTQLAAIMKNKGTLYAVERHLPRYRTMCQLVPHLGVKCVHTINADSTTVGSQECQKVKYILVDPTCSGSGMDRHTASEDEVVDEVRIQNLAKFQVILLEKALTNFPSARRVVYSTCSICPEENEEVVERVLANVNAECTRWKLAENLLETWPRRGSSSYEVGPKCIVTDPDKDLTTGCFIAAFERVGLAEGDAACIEDEVMDAVKGDEGEGKRTKKAKKRKRKRNQAEEGVSMDHTTNTEIQRNEMKLENSNAEDNNVRKKKKKEKTDVIADINSAVVDNTEVKGTKKIKRKSSESIEIDGAGDQINLLNGKTKKKKKKDLKESTGFNPTTDKVNESEGTEKKKTKKGSESMRLTEDDTESQGISLKIKKKKKRKAD